MSSHDEALIIPIHPDDRPVYMHVSDAREERLFRVSARTGRNGLKAQMTGVDENEADLILREHRKSNR